MALSRLGKAQRRAAEYEAAVVGLLGEGRSRDALTEAFRHCRAEAAKLRADRPGDGAYTDAEVAAAVLTLASGLHSYKPIRPAGAPRTPGPDDLVLAFTAALERSRQEGTGNE